MHPDADLTCVYHIIRDSLLYSTSIFRGSVLSPPHLAGVVYRTDLCGSWGRGGSGGTRAMDSSL